MKNLKRILMLLIVVIFLSGCNVLVKPADNINLNQNINQPSSSEQDCLNSGGTVKESLCCINTNDFPNNCLIGACGCGPGNVHQVKTCECGQGQCFNGSSCVSANPVTGINLNQNTNQAPAGNNMQTITLADNKKTIKLKVGDTFLITLGTFYDWNLNISDKSIVNYFNPEETLNVTTIPGNEYLKALKIGSAIFTATGDPHCRRSVPACAAPSILFKLNIEVE